MQHKKLAEEVALLELRLEKVRNGLREVRQFLTTFEQELKEVGLHVQEDTKGWRAFLEVMAQTVTLWNSGQLPTEEQIQHWVRAVQQKQPLETEGN